MTPTPPVTPEELREIAKYYQKFYGGRCCVVAAWACEQMAAQLERSAPSRDAAGERMKIIETAEWITSPSSSPASGGE